MVTNEDTLFNNWVDRWSPRIFFPSLPKKATFLDTGQLKENPWSIFCQSKKPFSLCLFQMFEMLETIVNWPINAMTSKFCAPGRIQFSLTNSVDQHQL